MDKNFKPQNTSNIDTRNFIKGMNKDLHEGVLGKDSWYHAINASNNSADGDVGTLGNEPANLECANTPYTIIGGIHLYSDKWVLFSTDNINSEIGLFDDSECNYTTIVNAPCLNFNKGNIITGASKENHDCTWQVYWDDGLNPTRTLNINDVPYVKNIVSDIGADCTIYEDSSILDCEKLRIAPLLKTPCLKLNKGENGGQLLNGSYQAFLAYTINGQIISDYIGISNVQAIFDHNNVAGSLGLEITNLDQEFDEYVLVIQRIANQQVVAKELGYYSTEQSFINIDYLDESLPSIPPRDLLRRKNAYEKSEAIFVVNDWLIRKNPTTQFDFNYQPIANNIRSRWVVAEYPEDYYYNGGNKPSFLRDEQYAFFIRWIYNTGERSSSYHIPGRAPKPGETSLIGGQDDNISEGEKYFQIYNTASIIQQNLNIPTDDGGVIIAKGEMGYWESTEQYPSRKPNVWGNLCGKPIRHHKMPSEELGEPLNLFTPGGGKIRILGVEFTNIKPPLDNDGNIINNIVGYEILRGSRKGNKSILAKGIFRNMREYTIPEGGQINSNDKGLYPNYPYNDLNPDVYFHDGNRRNDNRTDGANDSFVDSIRRFRPLTGYSKNYFTFHSPDLNFQKPFLSAYETRIYGEYHGQSVGAFKKSENHPQQKLLKDVSTAVAGAIGIGFQLAMLGFTGGVSGLSSARGASIGAQTIMDLMYNTTPYRDYVYKYNSHGFFYEFKRRPPNVIYRTKNNNINYLSSSFQEFSGRKINNLFRPGTVALHTDKELYEPTVVDNSRFVIGGQALTKNNNPNTYDIIKNGELYLKNPTDKKVKTISALYGALKFDFENQYGQLENINQILIRGCIEYTDFEKNKDKVFTSQALFGGDVYINRYTEKVVMPIFSDFLNGQPDGFIYNYLNYVNIPYPRYWINSEPYDVASSSFNLISKVFGGQNAEDAEFLPNDYHYVDKANNPDVQAWKSIQYGYMYTHVNGILDFFVESDYNLAFRDWLDNDEYRHYDDKIYAEVDSLFHADIIKAGNFYKYDLSLSLLNLPQNVISFGNMQSRYYDPTISENCYQTYSKRLIYSLRNVQESTKDFWRVFLPNNYKDFVNEVTTIKPINKSGAVILYPYQSPQMFQGIDQLKTDLDTKLTIGDGGLFMQPFQNIVNSDLPNEYGSCESMLSAVNTPFGMFYISQEQGSIYQLSNSLNAISDQGMKWWFNKYLPSQLKKQYPEIEYSKLSDNPIIGIGCQSIYDPTDGIVYFSKKDFKVKDQYINNITFEDKFYYTSNSGIRVEIQIGDIRYFEDCSWTVSYDPKAKAWISFHDWKPELMFTSINHFLTTKTGINTASCPPGYVYNDSTNKCEKSELIIRPANIDIDELEVELVFNNITEEYECNCPTGYDVVYANTPLPPFNYTEETGNCTYETLELVECYTIRSCDGNIIYTPKDIIRNIGDKVYWQSLNSNIIECGEIIDDSDTVNQYTGVFYEDNLTSSINLFGQFYCSTLIDPNAADPENICGSTGIMMDQPTQPSTEPIIKSRAICRKVECSCPPSPNQQFFPAVLKGDCPTSYQITDYSYISSPSYEPPYCEFYFFEETAPSIEKGTIWRHNYRCDLYANYYGKSYPWEIEVFHNTGQSVNTLRSIQYQLESYVYKGDLHNGCGDDRWHDLDFNFDRAIVYNTEQISGLLKLNLNPKEDPYAILNYPIVNLNDIDILYSKEEQNYRINQFWDITKDRGEFTGIQQRQFITNPDGYTRSLNDLNLNYQKEATQRKKFRHNTNKVIFQRINSGDRKMLFKVNNFKLNISFR